jgi:hypothetical protein
VIGQLWQVVDGEVRVAVDKAERWGASLAILVAAVHHPGALASAQLGTDPADVARAALAEVAELYAVAAIAEGRVQGGEGEGRSGTASVRRDHGEIVFSPGGDVANLAMCLEIFASAVFDPASAEATMARGATAYAASTSSADIRRASGALGRNPRGGTPGELRTADRGGASRAVRRSEGHG